VNLWQPSATVEKVPQPNPDSAAVAAVGNDKQNANTHETKILV
jgi:hypothetical protein